MKQAPIPKDEKERLLSLYTLGLLDTKPEARFDRITRMATKIFHVPISTLTLVDAKREWFKSCQGLADREGDRAISFCGHALVASKIFVIPDTTKDKRFSDNPMVVGKPFIRFYAGVPVVNADGKRIGVFCIKDTKPRTFSKEEANLLIGLAAWAELEINSRNLSLALAEQKKLQAKLIQQKKRTQELQFQCEAIAKSAGDGLVVVNQQGKIVEMNEVAGKLFGIVPRQSIGKHFGDVWIVKNERGDVIDPDGRPIQTVLVTGKMVSTSAMTTPTYYYVGKDKKPFPVAITASPLIFRGQVTGAVEIIRDVTKDKEVDKAKNEFVSLASHQLRTPLTVIKLLSERLLSGKIGSFSGKRKEYLTDIRTSNQRMIDLVNTLLNVSRIEYGGFSIQVGEKDICGLVQNIVTEVRPVLEKKQLKVKTVFPKKPVMMLLDESLFHMVLSNLVINAINYTPENGEIQVRCEVGSRGQLFGGRQLNNDYVIVRVADSGYGIPPEQAQKIFSKFFRADNAREKHAEGSGLGLYIVKSILDHSGGLIWFTSQVNKGSEFFVAIPMSGMKTEASVQKLIDVSR